MNIKKIIRREFISLSMVLVMVLTFFNSTNAQAETITSNDWISEYLSDYQPLQTLLKEYPNTKLVQSSTSYILNETTKDDKGNILKSEQKKFSSLSSMEQYEKNSKILDLLMPNTVGDGESTYRTYSKIRIGLSLYRYSSERFFVASTYEWIDGFDYDLLFDYKAVVGLAVGSDLSMEGSSYAGRVTMTNITGDTIQRTPGNGISIRATGAYGIGYSIKESAQRNGMLLDMQGVISCTARKSQPSINNCPAYGEYAAVAVTLDLNSFSVSIPAGISFSAATSSTPYSHQDNLDIR